MKLLIIHHAGFSYIGAIYEYISAFKRYSRHEISYYNIDDPDGGDIDLSFYDAIFVNYDAMYMARFAAHGFDFTPVARAIERFDGVKIVSCQDEYDFTNSLKALISVMGFDVVLTCVPQEHVHKIYPRETFPDTIFKTVLTGYASEEMMTAGFGAAPLSERDVIVGYRGRSLPYKLGDLGWHKTEVARRIGNACVARGLKCDISIDEKARIYGQSWFDFIKGCRVVLGSPSGSNVFDFDGSVQKLIADKWNASGATLQYPQIRDWVKSLECGFDMGQVSPRVFEAVACRTAMVLVSGNYSGLLVPGEHYIELKDDYSNVDEVMDRIGNVAALQDMVDRTYDHVMRSANTYFAFVSIVDGLAVQAFKSWRRSAKSSSLRTSLLPLGSDPYLLSRISYLNATCTKMEEAIRGMVRGSVTAAPTMEGIALMNFEGDRTRPN